MPEVPGPSPEEAGVEIPEAPVSTPTEETRRRRWYWPFGGRERTEETPPPEPAGPREELAEREAELEARRREAERRGGEPIGGTERIRELAESTNPEDLVHLMTIVSAEQFREMKLEEKHPGRLGKLRQILAAERDFSVDKDGRIRHNAWEELKHKALTTIFNKKTLLMAGTLGVVGVLTGGLAYPAAAALFGSIGGRGLAEGLEYLYGHERGRRQKIVEAQVAQWSQLREMALRASAEDIDPAEKARLYTEIINGFHLPSEQMIAAEERLGEIKAMWNRRREIFSAIGAGVGALGGLWTGLKGLTDLGIFNLDGNKIYHSVRNINHVWHFAYNNAAEIAKVKDFAAAHNYPLTIVQGIYHQVGAGSETIIARTAAQIGAVFAGLALGSVWKGRESGAMEDILESEQEERRQEMLGKVPAVPEAAPPPPTPEETLTTNQERYLAISREQNKGLPDVGQIWLMEEIHPESGEKYPVAYRIRNLDWANNVAVVDQLDSHNYKNVLSAGVQLSIENLLRQGREIVEDWLLTVRDGDEIEISANSITDRSDPKAPKVEAGKYEFKKLEQKPGQAELGIKGKRKPIVDILDLALAGVRPIEKGKEERGGETPRANEIWGRKEGVEVGSLPESLQQITRVGIAEVRGNRAHCFKVDERGRREGAIIKVNLDVLRTYFEYDEPLPKSGGGGGGAGGGGGQRQRERRNE